MTKRPHIMLFDSSGIMRALMDDLLTESGYRVTVSSFLPDSFDQIAAAQPQLVMIDLAPRDQLSWTLLERLACDALTRRIPVLVTSTNPVLLARAEAAPVRYGGQGWLVKPFEVETLLAEVRRLTNS